MALFDEQDLDDFLDSDDVADAATFTDLAYPHLSSQSFDRDVLFTSEPDEVNGVFVQRPAIVCKQSALPNIKTGYRCTVRGTVYLTKNYRPDESGMMVVFLEKQ